MTMQASIAPTKANSGTIRYMLGKASRMMMPNRPAPEETPMMPGSASGLPMIACRITPEVARLAPTIAASSTRGSRISQTTRCHS